MESLRKYLGYVFFGLVLAAAAVGVIIYTTDVVEAFKGIHDFDGFLNFVATWLSRVVCWTIITIMSIITLVKLNNYDAKAKDNKGVTFVLIAALAELIGAIILLIAAIKLKTVQHLPAEFWIILVLLIILIVANIVRKVSFANNVLVGKIMCAALALIMFVVMIVTMSMYHAQGKLLITYVLWLIAFAGLVAAPLLSSPLKQ